MIIDWLFACKTLATFVADLNDFCDTKGWPRLTNEDGTIPQCAVYSHLRIDLDWIENLEGKPAIFNSNGTVKTAAIMRGPHCNARGIALPNVQGADVILTKLDNDLKNYFNSEPLVDHDTPLAMQTAFNVTPKKLRATSSPTKLIPSVLVPKRVWA